MIDGGTGNSQESGLTQCPHCREEIVDGASICRHCNSSLTSIGRFTVALDPYLQLSGFVALLLALVAVCQTSENLKIARGEFELVGRRALMSPSPLMPSLVWISNWTGDSLAGGGYTVPVLRLPLVVKGDIPIDSIVAGDASLSMWGDTLLRVFPSKPLPKKTRFTMHLAPLWSPHVTAWPSDTVLLEYEMKLTDYIDSLMYMTQGFGYSSFTYWVHRSDLQEPQLLGAEFMVSYKSNMALWTKDDSLSFFQPVMSEMLQKSIERRESPSRK